MVGELTDGHSPSNIGCHVGYRVVLVRHPESSLLPPPPLPPLNHQRAVAVAIAAATFIAIAVATAFTAAITATLTSLPLPNFLAR